MSHVRARIGAVLLLGLALSLLMGRLHASPAQAESVGECQAQIAQVRALLSDTTNPNYVDSFTSEKDRTGLIGKLDSASTKLSQGKSQDALANLASVRDKVSTLVAQGKVDQADANVLLVEIDDAIGCVKELQAQTQTAA